MRDREPLARRSRRSARHSRGNLRPGAAAKSLSARSSTAPSIESTYKARDLESTLDVWFYRPIGFQLARFFAALRFTPSMVSLLGATIGAMAGHLYFYPSLRLNLLGMFLHLFTNALDNADGQLARMTNRGSLQGAIMDGFADYVVFVSIYVHLALRFVAEGGTALIWLAVFAAGASHAVQSMMIDFYRYGYLQFVAGKRSADANSSETVGRAYRALSWSHFLKKCAFRSYLNYTRQQEAISPGLLRLRLAFPGSIPDWLSREFQDRCRPLVRWCNWLATNPRMLLLFAFLLLGQPVWYFAMEITVLNVLLIFLVRRHNAIFSSLLAHSSEARASQT